MESLTTARDVPLLVISPASTSERRITPSWSISQLKAKLEPITGIPPSAQILSLKLPGQGQSIAIETTDEDHVQIGSWRLVRHAELTVSSSSAAAGVTGAPFLAAGIPNPNDPAALAAVPKATMPLATYNALADTVLSYKRSHQIGRFDPAAKEREEARVGVLHEEIARRGIEVSKRCHLAESDTRRGTVRYVGPIPELPGPEGGVWVGVELDEPGGKNDGSVEGKKSAGKEGKAVEGDGEAREEPRRRVRYFECKQGFGVFVRPDRVVVGDFPELDMEELLENEDEDNLMKEL